MPEAVQLSVKVFLLLLDDSGIECMPIEQKQHVFSYKQDYYDQGWNCWGVEGVEPPSKFFDPPSSVKQQILGGGQYLPPQLD